MAQGAVAGSSLSQEIEGARENLGKNLHCGFHWKEWATQG